MKELYCAMDSIWDGTAFVFQVDKERFIIEFDDRTKLQYFKTGEEAENYLLEKGFIW